MYRYRLPDVGCTISLCFRPTVLLPKLPTPIPTTIKGIVEGKGARPTKTLSGEDFQRGFNGGVVEKRLRSVVRRFNHLNLGRRIRWNHAFPLIVTIVNI